MRAESHETALQRVPVIPTFDPSKISEDCYKDLSNAFRAKIRLPGISPNEAEHFIATYGKADGKYRRFPPAASGFFYYHPPPPGAPDIAGDIRFRVTNNKEPDSFVGGTDLTIHGLPWLIPLVPNSEVSHLFLPSLRCDSLLTDDQVRRIERFSAGRQMHLKGQPMYAFRQPFRLHIAGWQAVEQEMKSAWKECWIFGILDGEDRLKRILLRRNPLTKWGYQQQGQPPRAFFAPGTRFCSTESPCSL